MPDAPLTIYLEWPKAHVIHRYAQVCHELSYLKLDLSTMKAQEHRAKIDEYWNNQGASSTMRDRAGSLAAKEITASCMELEGKINKLTEERFYIEHIIEWGIFDAAE